MQELIDIGLRQGTLIKLNGGSPIPEETQKICNEIKQGRFGPHRETKIKSKDLFVVLSQDCDIANHHEYIEIAQLRVENVKDEDKVKHLLLGRDYKKLFLKVEQAIYSLEEKLITKINKEQLLEALNNKSTEICAQLPDKDIRLLIDWRVQAYRRVPFPHNFNEALQEYLIGEGNWFYEYLVEQKEIIDSVRVYVNPFDEEHSENYDVSFCILFDDSKEDSEVENIRQELSQKLEKMVQELDRHKRITCLQNVDLTHRGITIPEQLTLEYTNGFQDFTFANALLMREYNFQYMCY